MDETADAKDVKEDEHFLPDANDEKDENIEEQQQTSAAQPPAPKVKSVRMELGPPTTIEDDDDLALDDDGDVEWQQKRVQRANGDAMGNASDNDNSGSSSAMTTMSGKMTNLGDFMQFGYYTMFIIILCESLLLPQMFNLTFMIYAGYAPRAVACGNRTLRHFDESAVCAELLRLKNETGCQPQFEVQFESVAYEFGYFCDSIVSVKKSISIQLLGVLLGALCFGQLSDSFGRKRVILVTHAGMLVFGYAASRFSRNLVEFTIIQFASLFFVGGNNTTMHVFLLENVPKRWRIIISTALSYSPNYILLAGVAYLAHEWRALLLVNSMLNVPAFLLLCLAFESPRWMIQSGQLERARVALLKIERLNGSDTPRRMKAVDELIQHEVQLNETKKRHRKYYLYHLFYTAKMTRYICVICFTLMSTSMLAYALLFNMEHLSGSIYLNSAIFGLIRYSMNLTVGSLDYFVPRVGRKTVLNGALAFILVMLFAMFVCRAIAWESALLLRVTTICAAAMCSQLFMISAVVSSELFPTAVRNLSSSLGQAWNRIGSIIAPHVFYLALSWAPLPYLLLMALMSTVMVLFNTIIPETKDSPMTDHMPERRERVFASRSLKRKSFLRMDVAPSAARLTED